GVIQPILLNILLDCNIQHALGGCTRSQTLPDLGGGYGRWLEGQADQAAADGGQLVVQGGGGLQDGAWPLCNGQMGQAGDFLPGFPRAEIFQLIGPQYPVVFRTGRRWPELVEGVVSPAAFYFDGVDPQVGVLAYGNVEHGQPVGAACGKRLALPRVGRPYQFDAGQAQSLPGSLGQADVGQMDGIEAPAEQACLYNHSRGFRNADNAASGLSSLGVQQ